MAVTDVLDDAVPPEGVMGLGLKVIVTPVGTCELVRFMGLEKAPTDCAVRVVTEDVPGLRDRKFGEIAMAKSCWAIRI